MRRPGYPRDPATRVNGVAGVTGYPARMLSSASRPFPSRGPLFLTSPYLSHLVFLSSPCGVESVPLLYLHPTKDTKRNLALFLLLFVCLKIQLRKGDLVGLRWNAGAARIVANVSRFALRVTFAWIKLLVRVVQENWNFEIDEGFGNLISVLWSLLAYLLRSLLVYNIFVHVNLNIKFISKRNTFFFSLKSRVISSEEFYICFS